MSGSKPFRKSSSAGSIALPETALDRRVSLTGYANILLDDSNPDSVDTADVDSNHVRVRFAELPSVGLGMNGLAGLSKPKRKYSLALQTLKPFRPSSKDGKLPVNRVGLFSYSVLSWLTPLLWKIFKNRHLPIAESDIWQCSDQEGVEVNTERMCRLWDDEVQKKAPDKVSFKNVWWKFVSTRSYVTLLFIIVNAMASFMSSAFLLNWTVRYLESEDDDLWYGIGLTAAMMACEIIRVVTYVTTQMFAVQTATRARAGYMGIMFDKLLKLRAIKGKTNSEIISVFSVDSYRIIIATWTFPYLLSLPIYICIATVYSYILIGYWCFVAMGTFAFCYVLQMYMTKLLSTIRRLCTEYNDLRVRRMSEVLTNMKFIKMYAWEKPFTSSIKGIRKIEQKYQLYSALVNAVNISIIPITPTLASIVTIAAYSAAGNKLNASTAFAMIGTMDFLRIIVAVLPFALRSYGEAKVSFKRLQKLLLADEYTPPSNKVYDKDHAVEIKAGTFIWETAPEPEAKPQKSKRRSSLLSSRRESINLFTLYDIHLEVKKGKLLGVCGQVGSGKSSLMSSILGRMLLTNGHLAVDGRVAYVSQQAWLFNASLKDNILFGLEYDEAKYKQVISCCGLEPDLKLLTHGDETEIGERGVNLSGGQKQRINLARAVYSDSDIYLLDDPLSALDVRVSKNIFHQCIKRQMAGKTVILVTHQLQYLKHCDELIVMDDGAIIEKGTHEELLAEGEKYKDMFRVYESTTMKATTKRGSSDGEPGETSKVDAEPKESGAALLRPLSVKSQTSVTKPKKEKTKLILEEQMQVGSIPFKTYNAYINACGGWCVAILGVLLYVSSSGAVVFADIWLSFWIDSFPAELKTDGNSTWTSNTTLNWTQTSNTSTPFPTTILPGNVSEISTPASTNLFGLTSDEYLYIYTGSLGVVLVFMLTSGSFVANACISASTSLHTNALVKIMKAPMAFFDSNPAGRILNRFSKDVDEADVFLPQVIAFSLRVISQLSISLVIACYMSPYIIAGIVPMVVGFYILKQISAVTIRQLKRLENVTRSPLIAHVSVTSQGLPTIVTYGQQERFFKSCINFGDVTSVAMFLFEGSMRWIGLRLDFLASIVTVTAYLVFVITKGMVSPAMAALVIGLCGKNMRVMQYLLRVINECEARFTSIERLDEYQSTIESENQTANKMVSDKWPEQGQVVFKDVVMKYRPELDPVLKTVNFEILPREKVGVIGRTGAGKSSLATALFRLVEIGQGKIIVDGEDISQLHLNTIRSKISTITQDPVLFSETMRYNVDPFSMYTDDQVWEALEQVHMKEKIVQFEDGLDSMVDENGENFSVGERQLICLARALLRSSKILLLDEATANIDTSTDALIQETIRECFADCTVITIAHRLNTVLHSNKIIVLDSGMVMECAAPQDLLSDPNSFFNAMIAAQTVKTPSPVPS